MAQHVPTVPLPIPVKLEILSDSEEVHCRLCHKAFASDVALRNHARMDHFEAYENGDPTVWTKPDDDPVVVLKSGPKKEHKIVIQKKNHVTMSSLSPTSLSTLASNNVSYIIIKSNNKTPEGKRKRSAKKDKEENKVVEPKRSKSPQVIGGPFECLEPCPNGVDGACHQIFFSCCAYSQHARTEHSRRRRAPRCVVCERALPAPSPSPGGALYACESCTSTFDSADELQSHMTLAHVKLKPYKCSVCNKRFTQQGGVLQHMRMHSGDRPFPCTYCDKAFTQKSGLDQHTRTHTKEKPYRCVVCGKTFIQSVHLKQHMRTHTNLTPFQCGVCDKRFKQSSHLNYHLKNHNPISMTSEQRNKYNALIGKVYKQQGSRVVTEEINTQELYVHSEEYTQQGDTEEGCNQQGDIEEYLEQGGDYEEVHVEEEGVEEGYVEEEEVEQMEDDGTYEVDPRDICTVEEGTDSFTNQTDTYIIGGTYEDSRKLQ